MRYLIYARVSPKGSSWDASDTSIQMQIDYCTEYVKFHGGDVVEVVTDEFFSGKDITRPGFRRIMDELSAYTDKWDTLIVYKLSRMTRSLRDGAEIFAKLFEQGKGFISATEHLDFSTPSGRAMLGVMQVFNQFEREQTAENIKNKMVNMASKGNWVVGKAPFGYKRGEKKDNKLYIDERKAMIVKDIFEMYTSPNLNTVDILQKYKGTIAKTLLFTILKNRVYLGKIVYAGHEFEGLHEPIISEEIFNRAQELRPLSANSPRPKAQKYSYLLTGLLKCHYGCSMAPASAKAGRYHYYVCTDPLCKNRVKAESVEEEAVKSVSNLDSYFTDELKGLMLECLQRIKEEELKKIKPELQLAESARMKAEKERNDLYKKFLELEDKESINFINSRMNYLTRELDSLTAKVAFLKAQDIDIDVYKEAEKEIKNIEGMANLFKIASLSNDRLSMRQILLTNLEQIKCGKEKGEFEIIVSQSSPNSTK